MGEIIGSKSAIQETLLVPKGPPSLVVALSLPCNQRARAVRRGMSWEISWTPPAVIQGDHTGAGGLMSRGHVWSERTARVPKLPETTLLETTRQVVDLHSR